MRFTEFKEQQILAERTLGGFEVKPVQLQMDEFAPPGGDDHEPNEEEILRKLAAQWWNGDEDPRAEKTLAAMGWEIGQDEGYDNGGAFVVRAGDINGNSFISWPHEELSMDEGIWDNVKKSFKPDANWQQRAGQMAGHMARGAVAGGAHGHAVGHAMADTGVAEDAGPVTHRIALTVTDPNHPMASKRNETIQKTVRVPGEDPAKAINAAIAHYRRKGYKVHDHHYMGTVDNKPMNELSPKTLGSYAKKAAVDAKFKGHQAGAQQGNAMAHAKRPYDGVDAGSDLDDLAHKRLKGVGRAINKITGLDEAIKLDAPQRKWSRDELQGYADRIKTGTKTKKDKFNPTIHGSNIKAITKDSGEEWDLDDLAQQITTRPRAILGTNAKMEKSATEGEIVYDLTLPALSGIVVDEETSEFVEINTCPGAGGCQLFCYARKGGYVMFPASSMSAAQALNFLVNDPEGYTNKVNQEINSIKGKTDKRGIQLVVRWHDAGDFFSKEYLDLAFGVARANPDVKFYAYTKMGDVATGNKPANFIINFSSGSKRGEEKKVELHKSQGNIVKDAVTLPKDMFRELFVTDAKGKYVKDEKGRTQVKSPEVWKQFKNTLGARYKIDPSTIITYDQLLTIPEGPKPKWNVVIFPAGHGDRAANRLDVINSFLMFH